MAEMAVKAQRAIRKAIERTYDGSCRIYGMEPVKDQETKVTRLKEVLKQSGIPCHLSYSGAPPAAGSSAVTAVQQSIKLFLAPELVVPPGSRIEVTQLGRTESYGQSGKAAVFSSHQEILLELWRGYA